MREGQARIVTVVTDGGLWESPDAWWEGFEEYVDHQDIEVGISDPIDDQGVWIVTHIDMDNVEWVEVVRLTAAAAVDFATAYTIPSLELNHEEVDPRDAPEYPSAPLFACWRADDGHKNEDWVLVTGPWPVV